MRHHARNVGGATVKRLQSRTTSRSSTTSRPPTRTTCRRPRSRWSATPTRPTTSTTSPTSRRRKTATCRPCSFLKAAAYQDGHAGYSDPLDEQSFLVERSTHREAPRMDQTAIVIAYDDSDGWYDHLMGPIVNSSRPPDDALTGPAAAAHAAPGGQRGSLRLRPAAAAAGDLAVREAELRRPHLTDQTSILQVHRGQLGSGRIGGGSTDAVAGAWATCSTLTRTISARRS